MAENKWITGVMGHLTLLLREKNQGLVVTLFFKGPHNSTYLLVTGKVWAKTKKTLRPQKVEKWRVVSLGIRFFF